MSKALAGIKVLDLTQFESIGMFPDRMRQNLDLSGGLDHGGGAHA